MPACPTAVCIGSGHITSQSDHRLLRGDVKMGPWEGYGRGQRACVWARSFGAARGEKEGEESRVQSRLCQGNLWRRRCPLGACLRSRKEREGEPTLAGHTGVSWASKTTSPHRTKETLRQTGKDTLHGAQGKERSQGHPGEDSLSLSARTCPQWDTSLLPPRGSTTARLQG